MAITKVVMYQNLYKNGYFDTEKEAQRDEAMRGVKYALSNALDDATAVSGDDIEEIVDYMIKNSTYFVEKLTSVSMETDNEI